LGQAAKPGLKSGSKASLEDLLLSKCARVAVIGMGYVGLPLAVAIAEAGFQVTGIDVDEAKVAIINRGESHIPDVQPERVVRLVTGGSFSATAGYEALAGVDAAIICVPTPLGKSREPDISYIIAATDGIAANLRAGMLVILESTTYPGTTEEVILPRLQAATEAHGAMEAGRDFFLAFSPERVDPGRSDWTIQNTPKVLAGVTPQCLEIATALYSSVFEHLVPVASPKVAEMVKLLENTFRAVNIGLVNEMALICDRLDIDVWEVIAAASSKPFGFVPFYPGLGLGGHCLPIDPEYLVWKLKTLDYNPRFIQLATEVNQGMPVHVLGKIVDALNDERKPLRGSRVLILGVAYKADVSDLRESPALDLIELLQDRGAVVAFHDPLAHQFQIAGETLTSTELDADTLSQADCVVISTAHSSYDWAWIVSHARLIVDTRNATYGVPTAGARIIGLSGRGQSST